MATNIIPKLALKIYGAPKSGVGYGPIWGEGNFIVEDPMHEGFGDTPYFSIKRDEKQTLYCLFDKNVKSCDGERRSVLALAVAIPRGYRLRETTPYQVIEQLYRLFQVRYMISEGNNRRFKNVDTYDLSDVVNQFTLVSHKEPYRTMDVKGPKAYIETSREQIARLFEDINYLEFAQYSEVLVAERVSSTSYTKLNLTIPRPVRYQIIVNNNSKPQSYGVDNPIVISTPETGAYEAFRCTFTVQDVLDGSVQVPGATFVADSEQEQVRVTVTRKEKVQRFYVQVKPTEFAPELYRESSRIQLTLGGTPIVLSRENDGFSFTLRGRQLEQKEQLQVRIRTEDYILEGWEFQKDVCIVRVRPKPQSTPAPQQSGLQQTSKGADDAVVVPLSLSVSNPKEMLHEDRNGNFFLTVKLREAEYDKCVLLEYVFFTKKAATGGGKSKGGTSNEYEGKLVFPKDYFTRYTLRAEARTADEKQLLRSERISNAANRGNIPVCKLTPSGVPWKDRLRKKKGLILLLLLLLLGLVGSVAGYKFGYNQGCKQGAKKEQTVAEEKKQQQRKKVETAENKINELFNSDFTFAKLKKVYDTYYNELDSNDLPAKKLKAYYQLSQAIPSLSKDDIKKALESSQISSKHEEIVRRAILENPDADKLKDKLKDKQKLSFATLESAIAPKKGSKEPKTSGNSQTEASKNTSNDKR